MVTSFREFCALKNDPAFPTSLSAEVSQASQKSTIKTFALLQNRHTVKQETHREKTNKRNYHFNDEST